MQGNAAVLLILHSCKGLISSGRNFHRAITQSAMFIWCLNWCLKQPKFSISGSFIPQKSFLNYTVILVSFPSGACTDEVVGNWNNYHGYKDDVYFLRYHTWAAIYFMNHKGLCQIIRTILKKYICLNHSW